MYCFLKGGCIPPYRRKDVKVWNSWMILESLVLLLNKISVTCSNIHARAPDMARKKMHMSYMIRLSCTHWAAAEFAENPKTSPRVLGKPLERTKVPPVKLGSHHCHAYLPIQDKASSHGITVWRNAICWADVPAPLNYFSVRAVRRW